MVLVCTAAGTLGGQALEERDDTQENVVARLWDGSAMQSVQEGKDSPHRGTHGRELEADESLHGSVQQPTASPAPTEEPVLDVGELPEPTPATLEPELALPGTDVERVICEVFGTYCADALAVAQCESTDYYSEGGYYHIGGFQLAFEYHADKFAAHGWDMWAEGNDIYKNSVIAFEIFAGRGFTWLGTSGWPVCGWRAGY